MGAQDEFERVRTALHAEEQALAEELDRIEAEARAAVDASVEQVRADLATQSDRIREAIAQQRDELEEQDAQRRAELDEIDAELSTPVDELGARAAGDVSDGDAHVDEPVDEDTHADRDEIAVAVDEDGVGEQHVVHVDHVTHGDDEAPHAATVDEVDRGD